MAGELFKAMSGTQIAHVPHKASGDARSSIMGGHVQMMFDAVTTMAPTSAGQVRALATTGRQTLERAARTCRRGRGRRAGYEATIWLGLMAPAGHAEAPSSTSSTPRSQGHQARRRRRRPGPSRAGLAMSDDPGSEFDVFREGHREVGRGRPETGASAQP